MIFADLSERIVSCPRCGLPIDVSSFIEPDDVSVVCPSCGDEVEVEQ